MRMNAPGMAGHAATMDVVSKQAWLRLFAACALSLLLHVALLVGVPVNPTGGLPKVVSMITARLEPAAPAPSDVAPATVEAEITDEQRVSAILADPPAAIVGNRQLSRNPPPDLRADEQRAADPAPAPNAGIEVPLIRDPTYYAAKQLDVYPQPLAAIRLEYPETAAYARVDGSLTVLLLIDEFGIVNDVSVVDAKPEGYFEEAAMAVFRGARFSPAQRQGHAVKSRVMLQVKYLYGNSASAAR
jgi:protein TonB